MKIKCPHCQKEHKVPDEYAGKVVKCAACHEPFTAEKMVYVHPAPRPPEPAPSKKTDEPVDFVTWPTVVVGIILAVIFAIFLADHSGIFHIYFDTMLEKQLTAIESVNSTITVVGAICIAFGLFIVCLLSVICKELKEINYQLKKNNPRKSVKSVVKKTSTG
ncbi:MAG: hypothetical protein FVQ82_12910 [Planctomycetes bacterium]|nr:hypothetical protein [Planctomycetota bacterium]